MSDARLKSLADRINRLMDERDALSADLRDIYSEAKGVGYIPKALRKVVARLRADPDKLAEEESLIELYEAALGRVGKAMAAVRNGATLDDAAEANGVHRATLARARAVAKQSENATPETPVLAVPAGDGTGTDVTSIPAPAAATISPGVPDELQIPSFLKREQVRA